MAGPGWLKMEYSLIRDGPVTGRSAFIFQMWGLNNYFVTSEIAPK